MFRFSLLTKRTKTVQSNASDITVGLPTKGGRSSIPESAQSGQQDIISMLNISDKNRYKEYIEAIRHLCKFDKDFGLALDNIATLANSNYTISFDSSVSDEASKEMIAEITSCSKEWYGFSEGLSSLIGDLFSQAVITGAVSGENIPTNNLDGLKKIVLVDPKDIVFKYDTKEDIYQPYQEISGILQGSTLNLNKLNTNTYKYLAIRRFDESPIGVPPLLTAIENMGIEKDMLCNLKHITKKLGTLGFLEVMVNAPKKKPTGETDEQYQQRCLNYLRSVQPEVEKGLGNGFMIGFKGNHEVKMQPTATNVSGAKELFDLNSEMKLAGLKQDPLMLGRNFSTTEALGRVLLVKLTRKLTTYQKTVAAFLEEAFKLHLLLKGFKFNNLTVEFEASMLADMVKEEQAKKVKIENLIALYNQGIISQQDVAEALAYEQPDEDEPRRGAEPNPGNPDGTPNPDITEED